MAHRGDIPFTFTQVTSQAIDLALQRVDAFADVAVACGGRLESAVQAHPVLG
jgi:hypothetical protein